MSKSSIVWRAHEFRHYEKNTAWYVTFTCIALLFISFFVFVQSDYFAAITIAIISAMVIFFATQKPEEVEMELTEKHVRFGNLHYPYKQIKHFWIVNNHKHKTLNLETVTYVNNLLILELGDRTPEEIREFLLPRLKEHELTQETFSQRIMHWFKF